MKAINQREIPENTEILQDCQGPAAALAQHKSRDNDPWHLHVLEECNPLSIYRLVGKASASRAADLCSIPAFTVDLFPG